MLFIEIRTACCFNTFIYVTIKKVSAFIRAVAMSIYFEVEIVNRDLNSVFLDILQKG